ncbi:MAG TPA: TonB-dependent receptor [Cellvibrio sp.]|nr:TonB-dependent receptor [Cellvibrio sp.]
MNTTVTKQIDKITREKLQQSLIPHNRNKLSRILSGLILLGASSQLAAQQLPEQQPASSGQTSADAANLIETDPTGAGVQELLVLGEAEKKKTLKAVHDEPISISIVSGSDLDRELAQDYNAISKRLANVTFNQSNTRGASLSVRGVGKRAFSEVQDPSVLVVQDDVSFGLTSLGNFDFYDIETVEGHRGPQGTLGGKGGSSGAVYVTTKRPSFTPSSDYSLTYGQRDTVIVKAATGGPVIEDLLAWRGAMVVDKGRGYYESEYDENYSMYNKNRLSGRVQFLLTPSEKLDARLSVDIEPKAPQLQNGLTFRHDQPITYENGALTDTSASTARGKLYGLVDKNNNITTPGRAWFSDRDYTYYGNWVNEGRQKVNFNQNQGQTVSNKGASTEINYKFENHSLKSITAWREFTFDAHNDEGTPFDISRDGGGGVFYEQYSQEFRISANPNDTFDYQGGIIFFKTNNDIVSKAGWGSDAGAWFASVKQYEVLDRPSSTYRGAGLALLKDSLDDALRRGDTWVDTQSNAIYGQSDWHWSEQATLTTGLRIGSEDRRTEDRVTLIANGSGRGLNPVQVRGISLGGFQLKADGTLDINNTDEQLRLADSVASRYYGATITNTPGDAYKSLVKNQTEQVVQAKALRAAQIGQLYNSVVDTYEDTLYTGNISQSYKFNDEVTGYATWQHGEKSGTGFNINGVVTGVKPEITNSYELGIKTFLFDETLTLNLDIFVMDIKDYQQAIRVVDEFTTEFNISNINPALTGAELQTARNIAVAYTSAQGNVNKVQVQGIEFDGSYTGIDNITLRFSGAYNDAVYKDFKNSPKPDEWAYKAEPFVDQTGKNLPGAAKFTFNFGAEYRRPVFEKAEFHTSFNTAYTSSYLNNDTLSSYSYIAPYSLTDAAIGLGAIDSTFDVSLIVKNLFDERPHEVGWTTYDPSPYPRWVGVTFSSKF